MPTDGPVALRQRVNRREFLRRAGCGAGMGVLIVGAGAAHLSAQPVSPYPDWIPPSSQPPKPGGVLTRASSWDPPVLDPRLTQSIGLFQFAALTSNRLVRYAFADEASGTNDLTLKGDLAESWQSSPDHRVWTFKLRQGVKWHNVPPLNGRELVAADVKHCFEAYAKEGVQSFTFREIEGMETPDKHTLRVHLQSPNVLFPQNLAEPITVIFAREVLEEDGDLKKRLIGTGPYLLKEHTRKVRVVLARNPDYFDKGRPYVDEYTILSTPDAATRLAAFRTGQSDILWLASLGEVETVRKTNPAQLVQQDLKRNLNINVKITKLDYTTYYGRYVESKWDGMAWGIQSGHAVSLDERTYQYMHSKSTKNFFRVNDPLIDELTTKLRQTPDRGEQRTIARKIVDREYDQVLRMWMPYDNGFLVFQPHVRNMAALALRRTDGYGASAIARLWLDK